jgi:hypothetical protein
MASCISWSNDFSPSAIDWVFYKYQGMTVRSLSLRRTFLTCDSGSTVVCFLIASLRCCRKIRGFSLGCCCKAKLLFYIDTWYSGEQVSEPFWASVSSLEEWGIWSTLNYFLPLWHGWSDINTVYLPYHFFFDLATLGNWTQGLAHAGQTLSHWAMSLAPNIYFFLSFGCTGAWIQDFVTAKRHSTAWAVSLAPFGLDLSRGLTVPL